jgi:hypothetical protein
MAKNFGTEILPDISETMALFRIRLQQDIKSLWITNVYKERILNMSVVKFPMKIKNN